MDSSNFNNTVTKIKHDRKRITNIIKNNIENDCKSFNYEIKEILKHIKRRKDREEIVAIQNEILEVIDNIKNTKIKSEKDCNKVIKYRSRFNSLTIKLRKQLLQFNMSEETINKYNDSLTKVRKTYSSYIKVIKKEKNFKFIQLSLNQNKLLPEAEEKLLNTIKSEKRYNKSFANSNLKKNSDEKNLEIFNNSIKKISSYLKKHKKTNEYENISNIQNNINEIINEINTTKINNIEDCDKFIKLRNKLNYQCNKIKKVIKSLDIQEDFIEEYEIVLAFIRKSISSRLKTAKDQYTIESSNNINNEEIVDFPSTEIVLDKNATFSDLAKIVNDKNNSKKYDIVINENRIILKEIIHLEEIEDTVKDTLEDENDDLDLNKGVIPQASDEELNEENLIDKNLAFNEIENNKDDNIVINATQEDIETTNTSNDIEKNKSSYSYVIDTDVLDGLEFIDINPSIKKEPEEGFNLENIEEDFDKELLDENGYPIFPNDIKSIIKYAKNEFGFMKKNINIFKSKKSKAFKPLVTYFLSVCILANFCLKNLESYVHAQNNENSGALKVTTMEDLEVNEIENLNNKLFTNANIEVASLPTNPIPSSTSPRNYNKIPPLKNSTVFKQNFVSQSEMSHEIRERELLTNAQLDTLLNYMCDINSNFYSLYFENREDALYYLYTHPERPYEEKMLVIMARENLTFNELNTICAIAVAESNGTYDEAYNVASDIFNRTQNTSWRASHGTTLYSQATGSNQFIVYQNERYEAFLGQIDLEAYQGALDMFYSRIPSHNYLCFRASSENISGKQLTERGNIYFNNLSDEQRIESDYISVIERELASDEPRIFNHNMLETANKMTFNSRFK